MLKSRSVLVAAMALALLAPAFARTQVAGQPPPAKPPTGIVVGQLVDGSSGSPVSTATVSLAPASPSPAGPGGGPPQPAGRNGSPPGSRPMDVLTDGNGRFVFHSLPAGSYSLTATRAGYIRATYGQTRAPAVVGFSPSAVRRVELTDGQRLTNLSMKIWKYASISGRLVDEAGEPAVGATLYVVAVTGSITARQYSVGNLASTDDRGAYRLAELYPGQYLIMFPSSVVSVPTSVVDAYQDANTQGQMANPIYRDLQASGVGVLDSGRRIGDQLVDTRQGDGMPQLIVGESGAMAVYPVTFYPGVRPIGSATPIRLEPGEERSGVDFAVRPVPATTVNGRVAGPDGPVANVGVKLVPLGLDALFQAPSRGNEVASAVTRADGTFTLLGVPAGDYSATVLKTPTVIRGQIQPTSVINVGGGSSSMGGGAFTRAASLTEPVLWGRTPVSVGATSIEGVAIRLAVGITVSGRVEFEAGAMTPLPTSDQLQQMRVSLAPVEGVAVSVLGAPMVAADASFKTLGNPPGRYHIDVSRPPPGWTLESITVGGRNVAHQPVDLVGPDLTDVVVMFTDKAGEISGTVVGGGPDSDVRVIVFPVDYQAWIQAGMNPRALPSAAPSQAASFRLAGVLPGDYLVVAVSYETSMQALQSTSLMTAIAQRGTRVTIGEREKRTLSLTVVAGQRQP